jgi:hypothetical protein
MSCTVHVAAGSICGQPIKLPAPGQWYDSAAVLPCACRQVAASSISMAVSREGQLYVWGLTAGLTRRQGSLQERAAPAAADWLAGQQVGRACRGADECQ